MKQFRLIFYERIVVMYEKMYANLHFHSTHSDGEDTIEALIKIALSEGYKALALADHNTATGMAEMEKRCNEAGLGFIKATEFSIGKKTFGTDFHIVGFDFDATEPKMAAYLKSMTDAIKDKNYTHFKGCVENGTITDITWDDIEKLNPGIEYLCHDHIFRAMRDKGLVKDTDYVDFWNDFSSIPYEWEFEYKEPDEVISLIKNAGGVAVLAHPNEKFKYVEDLVKMGLGGIESWHPDLTDDEALYAQELAKKHSLYISGGTDHCGLMGGQYKFYEGKDENPYFIPSLKYGATEENFMKLKERVLG